MKMSIRQILPLLVLSTVLISCSSKRIGLAPARGQATSWTSGSEVLLDSSKTFLADSKIYSIGPPVQFMVHLVNKADHPVNVNPSSIYTIQTNDMDETRVVNCTSPDYVPASSTNPNNDAAVGAAVAVGLLAILVVGVAIAASSKSKSSSNNSSHDSHKSHHYHNNYNDNNCCNRSYNCCDDGNSSSSYSNPSKSAIPYVNPDRLLAQTLQPRAETKGVVQVHLIPDIKKLTLVIPGENSNDEVRLNYDAYEVTY